MAITLQGVVHTVHEAEQKTEKFTVREMILTVDPSSQWPAYVTLQATNNNVTLFDGLQSGQEVIAHININGRLYQDKTTGKNKSFNSLVCWKLEHIGDGPASTPPPTSGMTREAYNANPANQPAQGPTVEVQTPSFDDGEDDGLPFS